MPEPRPTPSRPWKRAILGLVLFASAGCYSEVGWLPDSSGFIYTTAKGELVRFDVTTGQRHVLVADTGTLTTVPALSPDGKQIVVARLFGKGVQGDHLQIITYDRDGKELSRSRELAWRPGFGFSYYDAKNPLGYVELSWLAGPTPKLFIQELYGAGGAMGILDLKTNELTTLEAGAVAARPAHASLVRPDGAGFIAFGLQPVVFGPQPGQAAFVDWR